MQCELLLTSEGLTPTLVRAKVVVREGGLKAELE